MPRLLELFSEHPYTVLLGLLLLSLLAATQISRLQVQVSAEELFVKDDPQRRFYDEVRQVFGDEKTVLLVLEDPDVLEAGKLVALREVIDQLEKLPFVTRVVSLFTVPYVRSVEGYLDKEPYLAKLPESDEESAQLYQQALENPFVSNVLLSSNGRAMAVAIILDQDEQLIEEAVLTTSIDTITRSLEGHFESVYNIGFAYVRNEISRKILQEQIELMPVAVAALLIVLFLLLRQLIDVLMPILTAAMSILWTFGMMGLMGIPLNVVTSTVPILLVIVGSTEDIHLLSEFRHAQSEGLDNTAAIQRMARKMGRTVLLTFLTTFTGFLSVGLSGIEVLWQFAFTASSGLLFNFLITISLIPVMLRLAGRWQLDGGSRLYCSACVDAAAAYWLWLQRNRWYVLAGLVLFTVVAAYGIPSIKTSHSAIDSLGPESRIGSQVERLNEQFAGLESFAVIVDSGIQDTFHKVRYLNELVRIQEFIRDTGMARSTTSFADYIKLLNSAFQEFDEPRMPLSDDVVDELMIFLSHENVKDYVTEDYSRARILVRHNIASTEQLDELIDSLQEFIATEIDPGLRMQITGDSVLSLSATHAMIKGQLQSIFLLLLFFVLIISLLFTDVRVGLLAAIPNMFPVIVLFGVMGYAEIPLNIGTTMAAAIAIGIAVDDTMHFMLRYNQELKTTKHQSLAMYTTLHEEAMPVLSTSIALIAGFLVFSLSEFVPVVQFGILSALVIASALIADFVITPLVISAVRLVTLWDLLSSRMQQQVIPKSPLFRGMRPWQIRRFVLSSTLIEYAPGDYVYHQHDDSSELYLVMSGVVKVTVPGTDGSVSKMTVNEFGSGEIFGDIAMLAGEQRKTNAVALTDTTVLVMSREAINSTTLFHPFISSRLFYNLSRDISRRWVEFVMRVKTGGDTLAQNEEVRGDEDIPDTGSDRV